VRCGVCAKKELHRAVQAATELTERLDAIGACKCATTERQRHRKVGKEKNMEMVSIKKSEYEELLERDAFLSCLEAAGVDNWEGYSIASDMMEETDED
jgi:hypothetical protein